MKTSAQIRGMDCLWPHKATDTQPIANQPKRVGDAFIYSIPYQKIIVSALKIEFCVGKLRLAVF